MTARLLQELINKGQKDVLPLNEIVSQMREQELRNSKNYSKYFDSNNKINTKGNSKKFNSRGHKCGF